MRMSAIPHDNHKYHATHVVTVNLRVRQSNLKSLQIGWDYWTHASHSGKYTVLNRVSREKMETHWGEVRPCYDVICLQKFVPNI